MRLSDEAILSQDAWTTAERIEYLLSAKLSECQERKELLNKMNYQELLELAEQYDFAITILKEKIPELIEELSQKKQDVFSVHKK